jgi:hypothetical protein
MAPLQTAQTLQELDQQFHILKDQFPKNVPPPIIATQICA